MQACQESLQPGRGQGFVVLVTLCPAVSAYILACPFVNFYLFCTAAICCSIFSSKPESYFLYTICFFLTFSEHFRTIIYKIRSAVTFREADAKLFFPYANLIFCQTNNSLLFSQETNDHQGVGKFLY